VTEQLEQASRPPAGVAKNAGAQVVTFALRAASSVVLLAVLGHLHGPTDVGAYTYALQFTTMLTFLTGLGMQNLVVREVSKAPEATRSWIDLTSGLLLTSGALAVTVSLGASWLLPHDNAGVVLAVGLAAVGLVGQTLGALLSGAFYARERMAVETAATLVAEAGFLLVGLLVLAGGGSYLGLIASYAVSRLIMPAALLRAYRAQIGPLRPTLSWDRARPQLRRAVPFCFDDLLTATYVRVDVTLLQLFRGAREVGLYTSATLLTLTLNILARVLNWSLYPRLSRTAGTDPVAFKATVRTSARLLLLVGLPLAVGPFLLAEQVQDLLWGARFSSALDCYLLLTLVVPIRFLGHTTGTALTAADKQTWRTWTVGGAAVLNVSLNLWLIPAYGFLGAGVATIITETVLTTTYSTLLLRLIGPFCRFSDLLRPALACLPMAAVLLLVRDSAPLAVSVLAGALVYAVAALGTGAVTRTELRLKARAA
jgi:O-antigen/teichoic acid export membrane protein